MIIPKGEVVLPPSEQFGFCEGVVSADQLLAQVATTARASGIETVYGYHDIVHNATVRQKHETAGVTFVDDIADVPDGSIVVTSAHGVGPETEHALSQKGCEHFDAACPLVIHTHRGIQAARRNDEKVIYIGHGRPGQDPKLHDEIVGSLGHMDYELVDGELVNAPVERSFVELHDTPDESILSGKKRYRIISQTTLDAEACLEYRESMAHYIRERQPGAEIAMSRPGDVCRAVRNRQVGVVALLARKPERLIVVTDPNSKNGMGYVALGQTVVAERGLSTEVIAIATAQEALDLPKDGLTAITASASTPDEETRAVAVAFGADPATVVPARRGFKLEDADPADIERRISALANQK